MSKRYEQSNTLPPMTPEQAARITLHPVPESFEACCGSWSVDDQMDAFMRRA